MVSTIEPAFEQWREGKKNEKWLEESERGKDGDDNGTGLVGGDWAMPQGFLKPWWSRKSSHTAEPGGHFEQPYRDEAAALMNVEVIAAVLMP